MPFIFEVPPELRKKHPLELTESERRLLKAWYLFERGDRALNVDLRQTAKIPESVEVWMKHPNRYDIPGVDTPTRETGMRVGRLRIGNVIIYPATLRKMILLCERFPSERMLIVYDGKVWMPTSRRGSRFTPIDVVPSKSLVAVLFPREKKVCLARVYNVRYNRATDTAEIDFSIFSDLCKELPQPVWPKPRVSSRR